MNKCRRIGCTNSVSTVGDDDCQQCALQRSQEALDSANKRQDIDRRSLSNKYQRHFRSVSDVEEVDIYAVHQMFNLQDPSGCIQSASKKLLMSGTMRNGESLHRAIEEARDTLSRWLQLNTA